MGIGAPLSKVQCIAPAKLNLALHITGQRADGYHHLESLVCFTDLGDVVHVKTDTNFPESTVSLAIDGPFASGLHNDQDNLVVRAAHAVLATRKGCKLQQKLSLRLEKNLPIASGIGGGSADAAATLLCLTKLLDIPIADLSEIALSLGADVPMCIASQTSIACGIGDTLQPISAFPNFHVLMVNCRVEISTPMIFRALKQRNNAPLANLPTEQTMRAWVTWLKQQRNDLYNAAIELSPEIGDCLEALDQSEDILFAQMSGSGATCFGLFASKAACEKAHRQISKNHPEWWCASTKTREWNYDRAILQHNM